MKSKDDAYVVNSGTVLQPGLESFVYWVMAHVSFLAHVASSGVWEALD